MKYLKNSISEELSLVDSLEKAAKFVNNNKNIISNIYKVTSYNDEPKIYAYSALYRLKYKYNTDIASGFSFNKQIALMRVLGEGIERYCLEHYSPRKLVVGTSEEIKFPCLDPLQVTTFSVKQLRKKSFKVFRINKNSEFKWVIGYSISQKKKKLIPVQLVEMNYTRVKDEPLILSPISTGAAAGTSLHSAIYRGICEVVERDAFLISYLNKLSSPHVDLNYIADKKINEALLKCNAYRLEMNVIDLTTDSQIPAFAAVLLDKTNVGPALSVGLKAGLNIKESILGAMEEAFLTRFWARDNFMSTHYDQKLKKQRNNKSKSPKNKAYFWFSADTIKYLDFWLKNNNIRKITKVELNTSKEDNLEKVVKLLGKKNLEILYVDITHPKIKKYGFTVVKVLIPQLQPLYLDEEHPYLGGDRLYEVPVRLGYLKESKKEEQLNKFPHPFL